MYSFYLNIRPNFDHSPPLRQQHKRQILTVIVWGSAVDLKFIVKHLLVQARLRSIGTDDRNRPESKVQMRKIRAIYNSEWCFSFIAVPII